MLLQLYHNWAFEIKSTNFHFLVLKLRCSDLAQVKITNYTRYLQFRPPGINYSKESYHKCSKTLELVFNFPMFGCSCWCVTSALMIILLHTMYHWELREVFNLSFKFQIHMRLMLDTALRAM